MAQFQNNFIKNKTAFAVLFFIIENFILKSIESKIWKKQSLKPNKLYLIDDVIPNMFLIITL